jgi:predicted SnoaL-like aldol condensation-catalyzing enzyme
MRIPGLASLAALGALLAVHSVSVQQPAQPAPGCTATPAEIEANKKLAMAAFHPGVTAADRLALMDHSYVQHNPTYKKYADENKISYYEGFKQLSRRQAGAGRGGVPGGIPAGPRPPRANPLEIVVAECDLVTIIHKDYRQDPTAAAGTWYEAFSFDTLRVRDGKFVEHWDGSGISTPAPQPPAGARDQPPGH